MRHVLRVLVAVTIMLTVASPAYAGSRSFRRWRPGVRRPDAVRNADEHLRRLGRRRPVVRLEHRLLLGTADRQHRPFVQLHERLPTTRLRLSQPPSARPPVRRRPLEPDEPASGSIDSSSTDMKQHCWARAWYDEPTCVAWAEDLLPGVRVRRVDWRNCGGSGPTMPRATRSSWWRMRGCCSPDGLVLELEEEHRATAHCRDATALL